MYNVILACRSLDLSLIDSLGPVDVLIVLCRVKIVDLNLIIAHFIETIGTARVSTYYDWTVLMSG